MSAARRVGGLRVLLCDNHLLAVAKPACMPTVPDESGDRSLLEAARAWVAREFEKPGAAFLGVVHRLDRPVSGVVLFARTSKAARRLSEQFRERRVEKVYWGVCRGRPRTARGSLEQWLVKDAERRVVRAVRGPEPGARRAVTRWRVLRALSGDRTLVELVPASGRPHQLRVAMASLGRPLLGDLKYGAAEPLPDQSIALHARELAFDHPVRGREPGAPGGERVRVACEPPASEPWDALPRQSRGGSAGGASSGSSSDSSSV